MSDKLAFTFEEDEAEERAEGARLYAVRLSKEVYVEGCFLFIPDAKEALSIISNLSIQLSQDS